ncbi:uncharacterized protein LOC114351494 [Ostrinia furnacalis]|uniref:uncharacterized protein LOC114351494 n=1 Tax=Ostrinia furnacalis TaxID=93504 RepID=UPI00103CC279|nr:uncharacterized protein LOC114351494 [Ostrinia furnacalis]
MSAKDLDTDICLFCSLTHRLAFSNEDMDKVPASSSGHGRARSSRARSRGARGRGSRSRARGGSRGRACEMLGVESPPVPAAVLEPPSGHVAAVVQPSTSTSLAEGLKKVREQKVSDKKNLNVLTAEQRARLFTLREQKEVTSFLLPDAPEKKQKRKISLTRVQCPLTPGTPTTPPLPKPRPWETDKPVPSTSKFDPPPSLGGYFDRPVGACSGDVADLGDLERPSEVEIGAIQSVVEKTPGKRRRKLIFSPSTGIKHVEALQAEEVVVDAHIELLGFTPTSSTSNIPDSNTSTPKSLPAVTKEPSLFEDPEEMTAEWEDNDMIQQNAGSDLDDDLLDTGTVNIGEHRHRNVNDYPADLSDISSEHLHQLHLLDAEDDSALRDIADNEDLLHFAWSSDPQVFTGYKPTFRIISYGLMRHYSPE